MRESVFEKKVINDLLTMFPGAIILKTDPSFIQGFPDRLMLYGTNWAAFEFKKSINSSLRPNQEYYIDLLNEMSYASFIYPENLEEAVHGLQRSFRFNRTARFFKR